MKIAVPVTLVLDLVEELEIDESGKALDLTWARMILNEFDDHAVEQAVLLKERYSGEVTIIALESEHIDDVLFSAFAKGADHLVKLTSEIASPLNNHIRARAFADALKPVRPELVLIGVQAHDDLDGQIGPLLAEHLGYPYVGCIAGVELDDGSLIARKEYPGGLLAEMKVTLPAVLGIQAADQPPRYVAYSKVRQAMKAAQIEELVLPVSPANGNIVITRMLLPEPPERAEMLDGEVEEISSKLIEIFKEQGVL